MKSLQKCEWFDMLMTSCGVCAIAAGHVGRRRGLQQNHGNCVLRRGFRAGVAADAGALFAATHPEQSGFALQGFAGAVEQFDLQRLIGGT